MHRLGDARQTRALPCVAQGTHDEYPCTTGGLTGRRGQPLRLAVRFLDARQTPLFPSDRRTSLVPYATTCYICFLDNGQTTCYI
jgi:hypothetical protein